MPEKIQTPSVSQALTQEYSIKGRLRLALDETVVPVTVVGNVSPDLYRPCGVALRIAPLANNFNIQQLINPAGSGVIAYLDRVTAASSVNSGQNYFLEDVPVDVAATASGFFLDRRETPAAPDQKRPNVLLYTDQRLVALAGDLVGRAQQAATGQSIIDLSGFTLMPGTGFAISCDLINSKLECSFVWRERQLKPTE